ncbi:MAG: CoA transferase [Candidatus Rokubacteria bacterium]|nr:CoA transferase [Candidatus Rokubacteria bacterium]
MSEAATALAQLWSWADCDPAALECTRLTGGDPVLPTNFKIGTAATATIAAAGLAAAELWRLRTGRRQRVAVDARAAAVAFRSERYLRVDGRTPPDAWGPISGFYRVGDGRWIQLHCNFPHHRDGVVRLLGCDGTREAVAAAVPGWKAGELEDALAAAGLCAGMVRAAEEWREHPQAQAVDQLPVFEIIKLGDAPPEPCGDGGRPLSGVRVLDLTRVIAGPVCGRTLAEHGAEVLLITAEHLPHIDMHVMDNGRGKLSAYLDLRRAGGADRLRALVRRADVFAQSYRPGALAAHGFLPEEVARLRPGIVYVTVSAYSHAGPWRERRGFDSLVQSVSGIAHEGGVATGTAAPKHLPAQALDHATGYLAAFGAMVALARRAREGGSYLVRVSLAQTGRWIDRLGRVTGHGTPELTLGDIEDLLQVAESPFGQLQCVAPAAQLSETPGYWGRPSVPLGTHSPTWPT